MPTKSPLRARAGVLPTSWLLLAVLLAAAGGCRSARPSPAHPRSAAEAAAVGAVLEEQARQWNAGNLAGFMETYARSDTTRFASGGEVTRGWQTVFDRYRRKYGEGSAMGRLEFSGLEVTMLGPDSALAFGRWHLQRGEQRASGLFSLVLSRLPEGWRIVHDHTSAGE